MHIKTYQRTYHILELDGDIELELKHCPSGMLDPLVERVGDKIVVGYLVHNSDSGSNPIEDGCANGDLYTRDVRGRFVRSRTTDSDSEVFSALGLDCYGGIDLDRTFLVDGLMQSLLSLAVQEYGESNPTLDLNDSDVYDECQGEVEALANDLYAKHWQDLAGPFVVPISYHDERGSTDVSTTTWDGDVADLPAGVWVACREAIENITPYPVGVEFKQIRPYNLGVYGVFDNDVKVFAGTWDECKTWIAEGYPATGVAELRAAAVKYAEGILQEYSSWASGDVHGVVVEVFELDGVDWEKVDNASDSTWGFIGFSHAKESLKSDYFTPAVKALEAVAA